MASSTPRSSGEPEPPSGPLDGVLVLEMARGMAASFCSLILADLGARVIKIETVEPLDGPPARRESARQEDDPRYLAFNRNKMSCRLSLRSMEGRRILGRLVSATDVVIGDLSIAEREALGIGRDDVANLSPQPVFVNVTPFGLNGPYADRPATDMLIQALSGGMSMTGEPGRPPRAAGLPIAELCGGMWAAIAVLAALMARDGALASGCDVDLSLLDGQLAMIPYFSAYYFLDGFVPGPQGSGGHSPTYGAFRCSDDRYLVIAVIDQLSFVKLCDALDRQSLKDDPRFRDATSRSQHEQELRGLIEATFVARPLPEWEERLEQANLAYARVNRLDEVFGDPQVRHRGMVTEILGASGELLRVVDSPIKVPGLRGRQQPPPRVGEHTDAVLRGLGVEASEISRLRAAGVI